MTFSPSTGRNRELQSSGQNWEQKKSLKLKLPPDERKTDGDPGAAKGRGKKNVIQFTPTGKGGATRETRIRKAAPLTSMNLEQGGEDRP